LERKVVAAIQSAIVQGRVKSSRPFQTLLAHSLILGPKSSKSQVLNNACPETWIWPHPWDFSNLEGKSLYHQPLVNSFEDRDGVLSNSQCKQRAYLYIMTRLTDF
jgi:hypothetical protein